MNINPSAEELKNQTFIIKRVNDGLSQDNPSLGWIIGGKLLIANCDNITQRDQFGLSLKVKIDGQDYFLKLPPGPDEIRKSIDEKSVIDHYVIMGKRFNDDFEKCPLFEHIIVRCKAEMFSIARPLALCVVPMTLNSGMALDLPGLIYDYVKDGEDLSKCPDWISATKTSSSFLEFAKGLTRVVQVIHNQGVLHSFLVPRNIIKTRDAEKYTIVGFGYSSFCDSKHHAPLLKVSDNDTSYRAPECNLKENLGALWFPVDIYSIGAILYQLATGFIPNIQGDPLPRDVSRLKEHIYDKLSRVDPGTNRPSELFTNNENIVKILDRCLRYNPQDRFSCAEELIEALQIAEQATGTPIPDQGGTGTKSAPTEIHKILVDIAAATQLHDSNKPSSYAGRPENLNHLFESLLKGWSSKAVEDAERMQRGHHEIYGHRDVLVTSLCRLLAGAQSGNIYRTMTLPSYWTDNNLGSNGRFLTMNKHMARKGLKIERIFLVNKRFHELTEREQYILEFQRAAEKNVNDSFKGAFKVMVKELKNEDELTNFETNGTLVAYLESGEKPDSASPKPENCLCLNFVSHGNYEWSNGRKMIDHSIKKVRYWIPKEKFRRDAFIASHEGFIAKWNNSISLEEYIGDHAANTLGDLLARGVKFVAKQREVIT